MTDTNQDELQQVAEKLINGDYEEPRRALPLFRMQYRPPSLLESLLDWFQESDAVIWLALLGLICGVVALIWLAGSAEQSDLAAFKAKCLAIPKTEAECEMLTQLKESSDNAAFAASLAAGAAGAAAAGGPSRR